MNLFNLSLSYIKQRKLNTLLNVLLLAMGLGIIVVLLLFGKQFEQNMTRNAEGIDAVVGAKGSPLTLVLAGIYHMDAPTGNIRLSDAAAIQADRRVRAVLPLALGDSYAGARIVGTHYGYLDHYQAEVAEGRRWEHPLEVVLGADLAAAQNLNVGDTFVGAHGLVEGGDGHGESPFEVVGILQKNNTVLDGLILTSVETVWVVHEHVEETPDDQQEAAHDHEHEEAIALTDLPVSDDPSRELTVLLVQYASPIAAATFPRFINAQTDMQAASPAFETARLFNLLGIGLDVLRAFGWILIISAALGVFIALYNALKARQYDLAVMRSLGASRGKLLRHVLLEGLILAGLGTIVGLTLGHIATEWLGQTVTQAQQMNITGWTWEGNEWGVIGLALGVGLLSALIPAWQAYRTDIAGTLAQG